MMVFFLVIAEVLVIGLGPPRLSNRVTGKLVKGLASKLRLRTGIAEMDQLGLPLATFTGAIPL